MTRSALFTIVAYTILEAFRNRLLWLFVVSVLIALGLAEFIAEVAITETRAVQSAIAASVMRISMVVMVALFVITSIVRELNDKVLELVLSLPMPRTHYLLGKLIGFSAVAAAGAVLCGLCLLLYAPPEQAAMWAASLFCELLIVVALSLLCLFTFSQVTLALSTVMAFYALSRMIGTIGLIASSPLAQPVSGVSQDLIGGLIAVLAFLLPALDAFTSTEWLMYGTGTVEALLVVAGQTAVYVALLSSAALFDLHRKNL